MNAVPESAPRFDIKRPYPSQAAARAASTRHRRRLYAGALLAALNLLNVGIAASYFLFIERLGLVDWLSVNACTPSILLFLLGVWRRNRLLTGFAVPFLLFFGTGGLFLFPWDAAGAVPQVSHVVMTLSILWVAWDAAAEKEVRRALLGAAAGVVVLVPVFKAASDHQAANPRLYDLLRMPAEYRRPPPGAPAAP